MWQTENVTMPLLKIWAKTCETSLKRARSQSKSAREAKAGSTEPKGNEKVFGVSVSSNKLLNFNPDAESRFPHDRKKNEKKKKMSENNNRFQDIGFGVLNLKF